MHKRVKGGRKDKFLPFDTLLSSVYLKSNEYDSVAIKKQRKRSKSS